MQNPLSQAECSLIEKLAALTDQNMQVLSAEEAAVYGVDFADKLLQEDGGEP